MGEHSRSARTCCTVGPRTMRRRDRLGLVHGPITEPSLAAFVPGCRRVRVASRSSDSRRRWQPGRSAPIRWPAEVRSRAGLPPTVTPAGGLALVRGRDAGSGRTRPSRAAFGWAGTGACERTELPGGCECVARALALGGVMAGRREEWGPPVPQTPALQAFQGSVDGDYSVGPSHRLERPRWSKAMPMRSAKVSWPQPPTVRIRVRPVSEARRSTTGIPRPRRGRTERHDGSRRSPTCAPNHRPRVFAGPAPSARVASPTTAGSGAGSIRQAQYSPV